MASPLSLIPRPILSSAMQLLRRLKYSPFERRLADASRHQRDWLLNRIQMCRSTRFGQDHGFSEIRTLADFRQRVPVAEYSHFAPYINAVAAGDHSALIPAQDRLVQFTITTGSTGVPKLNPVTANWLREYTTAWEIWGLKLFTDHPQQIGNRILQMAGAWDMGRTESGHQISMVSALLARRQSLLLRPFYALPEILNNIPDPVARHYVALRLCIAEEIGWIILMNPGSLIRLAEIGDEHRDEMIRDVTEGTLSEVFEIPQPIRDALSQSHLRRNPTGGRKLRAIAERTGHLLPKDYWSQPVIACWLGGTAGFQSRHLADYFGDSPLRDMGLVSSEGRHTIPLHDTKPEGVPAIGAGFYEFVPIHESAASTATVLEGHELIEDQDYRLLITNSAGYFRFDVGDIVRCRGFQGQAPLLEFRQKSDRIGDLEGEKLTEHQIVEGAHRAASHVGVVLNLITGVPCRSLPEGPRYDFLVEITDLPNPETARAFLVQLDQELAALNFLWRFRRKEGVVGAPRLLRLPPHAWDQNMRQEIQKRGTGDFQYKHPGLVQDEDWIRNFQPVDVISQARLLG